MRSDRAQGQAYAGSKRPAETRERTSSAGGRRLGAEKRKADVERSKPGQARDRTATGGTGERIAPSRPETQSGAPRERPAPQKKAVDPVQESGAPLPAPDATTDSAPAPTTESAPESSTPGQVKPAE